jgi:2-polyprenyl-3-methyl-5-hydroxy-6-metoxy-1,4-benzoquinol methylase
LTSRVGDTLLTWLLRAWVSAITRLETRAALRRLYRLDDLLEGRIDLLAIELDDGVHAKHRIMRYHDFFVDRVRAGERVLDVGCGKGELAFDLAERAGALVTGVDVNRESLAFARARFVSDRLQLVEADIRTWVPDHAYDVVVLSNVLEHLADRVGLLRRVVELAQPGRILVRVPVLERDWSVVLRRELGLPYFSDPTHETEYDARQLEEELAAAGMIVTELQHCWSELWAAAAPRSS